METRTPFRIRTEYVLAVIALVCLALTVCMLILCIPHFAPEAKPASTPEAELPSGEEEDPEAFLHGETQGSEEIPEETVIPTIPPEANPYTKLDFQYDRNNFLYSLRGDSYPGIDVSAFQGKIDWEQVADSGIEFAIIRLGYRGYGKSGKLVEDEYAKANLKGATEAGLPIGVYFFSQALSIQEADEEIEFMLKILGDYELQMPIILDWEIPVDTARTANMDAETLTQIQLHFCQVMSEKGYQPMVYFNWYMSSRLLDLHALEAYPFWLALYQDRMTYPYRVEMWQYTDKGRVPGIEGNVDLNIYIPNEPN
ncbi:MAG: glycoside hydrolase family 25 protein [Oscillospiraceae bacterium]|nr:glycoside hydrolase family 25 protein [Oscillospiraceae bacterium]